MAVRVMKSPDGRLYEVADDEVDALVRDQGWTAAPDAEVAARAQEREQWQKYGGAGQQALGLAETAVRSGTLGLVPGLVGDEQEQRERANVVAEDSPVLNAAAAAAPALAAGVATGGAGLGVAGTVAAEAAIGGLGGIGGAADEAFRHDQELSAEAAFGSFAAGALLGGATAGALTGGAKVLGKARNRFVEASGRVARKAEGEAFAAAGIARPVKGLGDAMEDPVKRAALRQAGAKARPKVAADLPEHLRAMEQAEQAAHAYQPGSMPFPEELVPAQRNAVRWVLKGAQEEIGPANPALAGRLERVLESLDAANTSEQVFTTARALRASLDDMLETADSPDVARQLKQHAARARKLEADDGLFGQPAATVGGDQQVLSDLAEARQQLTDALDGKNYLDAIGTADGDAIETALDTYTTRLEGALKGLDSDGAKSGRDAIARLRQLRDGELRAVAGANQAKLMGGAKLPKPDSAVNSLIGEAVETAAEQFIPGFGMARQAWKYRKHIARLAGFARGETESVAQRLVRGMARRRGQEGNVRLGTHARGQHAFGDLSPAAQKAVTYAADGVPDRAVNAASKAAMREQIESAAKARGLSSSDREAALRFVDSMPDERAWNGLTARKYGELLGRRGDGQRVIDDFETFESGGAQQPSDPNLRTIWSQPKLWEAFQRGVDIGKKKAGSSGNVAVGKAPNFSLGDVAKSPMGAVTALGGLYAGAKTLGERGTLFSDLDGDPESTYRKIRGAVELLAKEPERLADALAAEMGDMVTDAPELLAMVNEKAARAVSFLQSKIPPAFGFAMLYPDGPPPSRTDMLELSLYWRGVTQPEDVVQAIGSGSVMPEEIEAFRAVNPVWFTELQDATSAEVAMAAREGHAIGGYKIAEIENLLDMHGKLDPAFSESVAEVARMAEEAEAAQAQQVANYAPQPKAGERITQDSPAI